MIQLTRLSGEMVLVNCRYIMLVEKTPDTVVTLHDGTKILVKEDPEEIITRIVQWTN